MILQTEEDFSALEKININFDHIYASVTALVTAWQGQLSVSAPLQQHFMPWLYGTPSQQPSGSTCAG